MIVMIVGSTGAGKDTVINEVSKILGSSNIMRYPSCTTRPKRPQEVDGIDYIFYSLEEMRNQCKLGKMVEVKKVYNNIYGTHIDSINRALSNSKIAINDYDVEGYANAKKRINYVREKQHMSALPIVTILIDAPDEVLISRIKGRNDNTDISGRIAQLERDRVIKSYYKYDYRVNNDNLANCVKEVCDIIINEYEKSTGKKLQSTQKDTSSTKATQQPVQVQM